MLNKCIETRRESGRCGDEHYRVLTIWARSAKTRESTRRCHVVALAYEKALDKLLECLKNTKPAASAKAELDITLKYKVLLAADINLLAGHQA